MNVLDGGVLFALGIGGIFLSLYYFCVRPFQYWIKKKVVQLKPLPIVGTNYKTSFGLVSIPIWQEAIYKKFKHLKYLGMYSFTTPTLMIIDPELVETVLIKDFTTFYNRGTNADTELDPLSAHLVNLEDAKWKSLRNKLTPTFSSGKLKGMMQQIVDCGDILVDHISAYTEPTKPFDVKEVMSKFTTDVISSCAFGLNTNALKNPDSLFRSMGKRAFQPSFTSRLRQSLRSGFPRLVTWLRWKSFPKKLEDFFIRVVQETIETREKNNVRRNDFLQLLTDLKKKDMEEEHKEGELIMDDKLIAANSFVFFLAGFETTASTLSYCLYSLSKDEQLQEKLYIEIQSVLKENGNEITYEALKQMKLMDRIISETLRMYPPAPAVVRVCSKTYQLPGTSLIIDKGVRVSIPIHSLHHDPQHYPNPDKFDPDRFGETYTPKKGTYLPFGDGPRICIGMRFARLEIKVALTMILTKYKFEINERTTVPLKFSPKSVLLNPIGGIWISAVKRQ